MRKVSATEASRNFSELLDSVEAGEIVTITRGHQPVAEIRPATKFTGRDLDLALRKLPPLDEDFEQDIADALSLVTPWEEGSNLLTALISQRSEHAHWPLSSK